MDHTIDVQRWITAAEEEVCWVDGALCAMGAEPTPEGIKIHDLVNLDAPGVANYLRALAVKLQTVATNLTYLADNADLTDTAENLKVNTPALVSAHPDASGSDTGVGRTATAQVTDNVTFRESLEGKTTDELLDMIDNSAEGV